MNRAEMVRACHLAEFLTAPENGTVTTFEVIEAVRELIPVVRQLIAEIDG